MAEQKDFLKKLSEPLDITEVDFRIQSISEKGYATVLAYKDARVDMNRLDEVCGLLWQDKYELIDGQLFCSIGIKVDDEWVWRQDVGIESKTEKEKGRASDAFKRAGFRWGIGRELYDYPFIFFQLYPNEFKVKQAGQKKIGYATYDLKLKDWEWTIEFDKKKPKRLIGKDTNGRVRFDSDVAFNALPKSTTPTNQTQPQQQQKTTPANTQGKTEKPKMTKAKYDNAMKSTDVKALTKALTAFALTPTQTKGISGRIAELNK